jgi:hypothetical protein
MTEEDDIARAGRANALLNDPLVVETFQTMEANYIKQWRAEKTPEGELSTAEWRERMWLLLQNLDAFRMGFETYIRRGQVAVAKRDQREKAQQAMRQDADT